jgi:hypothetical protein
MEGNSMKLWHIVILLLAQFIVMQPNAFATEQKLNIIYTGGLAGQLEPCGCSPKSDFGGIARIAGFLSEPRDTLTPYIIVDAGNFAGEDTPQGRLKTETMIKALGIIKYDAVAIAENELLFPADFVGPLFREQRLPVISEERGYNSSIVLEKDSFIINISTDPGGLMDDRLNILLTGYPVAEVKLFEGWDIIISSAGEELEEPLRVNKTIILSGYPKGKKLGILTVRGKGFSHIWQPVGKDLKEDAAVRGVLNDYDTKVAALMKEMEKPPAGSTYAGVEKCTECHQPFYDQWQNTRHPDAFSSLEEVGKDADPECVVCHVVGYREKGGFFSLDATPAFANVQCESCHGLNREHLSDFSPMKPVNRNTCMTCHTKENSPEFDYPVYLEKVKH